MKTSTLILGGFLSVFFVSCRKSSTQPTQVVKESCLLVYDYSTNKPLQCVNISVLEDYDGGTWNISGITDDNGSWCHQPLSNTIENIQLSKQGYLDEVLGTYPQTVVYLARPAYVKLKIINVAPSSVQDLLNIYYRQSPSVILQQSFAGITDTCLVVKADPRATSLEWVLNNNRNTVPLNLNGGDTSLVEINY